MPSLQTLEIALEDAAPMMEAEASEDDKTTVVMEDHEAVSRYAAPCQSDLPKAVEAELELATAKPKPTTTTTTVANEEEAVPPPQVSSGSDSPKEEEQQQEQQQVVVEQQQTSRTSRTKRRVTPTTESNQKKKQQKKVNQLKLGAFFFAPSKNSSPSPQTNTKPESLVVENKQCSTKSTSTPVKSQVTTSKPDTPAKDKEPVNEATKDAATPEKPKTEWTREEPKPDSKTLETEEETVTAARKKSTRKRNAPKKKKIQADSPAKGTELPHQLASEQADDDGDAKQQPERKATVLDLSEPTQEESSTPSKKRARKSANNDATKPEPKNKPEPKKELPEDRKLLLQKHQDMKSRYARRIEELVAGARGGLDEEEFEMPEPQSAEVEESSPEDQFPDQAVSNMVLLIEGSHLPLSKLVSRVVHKLQECHSKSWSLEAVTTKIKLLAKRKSYLDAPTSGAAVDLFEDETEDRLWRWEIISIEILPTDVTSNVRKARSARNKLRSHVVTTLKLVDSLRSANSVIGDTSLPRLDMVLAKISQDEEKALKYEREAEKQRLAQQAKRKKQQELDAKKKEKDQVAEEKRKEKERKKQEAEEKKLEVEKLKQETVEAREETKRKKVQRDEQKKKEIQHKEGALKKQQGMLKSFFAASPVEKAPKVEPVAKPSESVAPTEAAESSILSDHFDVDNFRSLIDSEEKPVPGRIMFTQLSPEAIASRKRRTREVAVSVYVTVMPDGNAFDAQPFAEPQVIKVPNKYRFLSFHEDHRPAYYGTWSRTSSVISGRNPFGKDNTDLDYDVDSEGEWEEGDDEVGEDVDDDDKNQEEDMEDEEGDPSNYNYQDGFCVADDEYLAMDEDADEETRLLYKKKLQTGQSGDADKGPNVVIPNTVCMVAPSMGGVPVRNDDGEAIFEVIKGFKKQEGLDIVASHAGLRLMDVALCLDAFPPALIDEGDAAGEATSPALNGNSAKQEDYSDEEVKLLARFAHHCTLDSKSKLIEELKVLHPTVFTTRAKATRKLDSIATKKRRKTTGVYWEVKKEVLEELGLLDVLAKKLEDDDSENECAAKVEKKTDQAKPKKTPAAKSTKGKGEKGGAKRKAANSATAIGKKQKTANCADVAGDDKKNESTEVACSKKKAVPASLTASANLMASFLKKANQSDAKPKASPTKATPATTTDA